MFETPATLTVWWSSNDYDTFEVLVPPKGKIQSAGVEGGFLTCFTPDGMVIINCAKSISIYLEYYES